MGANLSEQGPGGPAAFALLWFVEAVLAGTYYPPLSWIALKTVTEIATFSQARRVTDGLPVMITSRNDKEINVIFINLIG